MGALLSRFLRGLLYLAVLPGLLVVLAIYSVLGIFMFVFIGIKAVILYFTGRNIFGELPEDIRAREILEEQERQKELALNPENNVNQNTQAPVEATQPQPVQPVPPQQPQTPPYPGYPYPPYGYQYPPYPGYPPYPPQPQPDQNNTNKPVEDEVIPSENDFAEEPEEVTPEELTKARFNEDDEQ